MCINNTAAIKSSDSFSNGTTDTSSNNNGISNSSAQDYTPLNGHNNQNSTDALIDNRNSSILQKGIYTILWILITYISKEFAKFLSYNQSLAAQQTFIPAYYQYDAENTYFDNTFLTYGTDFIIGFFMSYASYKCYSTRVPLGYKASALFGCYAISVFCGGYAHYTFLDLESLNTMVFRLWWIACVGTVTAAGGFMGMCGSDVSKFFLQKLKLQEEKQNGQCTVNVNIVQKRFPFSWIIVSDSLWWYYGIFMTVICIMGEISYKRPACDIFAAGTTQFIPTVCCELSLLSIRWKDAIPLLEGKTKTSSTTETTTTDLESHYINKKVRILFYIGFLLNAPLLPSYPMLVQYTNLSLGVVNALLHLNLTFAWGMQAWSLYHICLVMKRCKGLVMEQEKKNS